MKFQLNRQVNSSVSKMFECESVINKLLMLQCDTGQRSWGWRLKVCQNVYFITCYTSAWSWSVCVGIMQRLSQCCRMSACQDSTCHQHSETGVPSCALMTADILFPIWHHFKCGTPYICSSRLFKWPHSHDPVFKAPTPVLRNSFLHICVSFELKPDWAEELQMDSHQNHTHLHEENHWSHRDTVGQHTPVSWTQEYNNTICQQTQVRQTSSLLLAVAISQVKVHCWTRIGSKWSSAFRQQRFCPVI